LINRKEVTAEAQRAQRAAEENFSAALCASAVTSSFYIKFKKHFKGRCSNYPIFSKKRDPQEKTGLVMNDSVHGPLIDV
jgi:hypothetical protein